MGGPIVSLEANILNVTNSQTLEMVMMKSINHEQMREFFRVDAVTNVISKAFETNVFDNDSEQQAISGRTVDISGSGILAIFEDQPPQTHHIRLEVLLPSASPETITVFAHQVRIQELHDGKFEVAYHFDDISDEDRDKIIGTCLVLQRQMLRLKVQVRNN
jgi:c-di-GMP-binding flagellar brake protein YcgR